ncbi:Nicotinate-nucleotide adenylyltransferase (EC [Olavius sp. associated proteobacterium Delta 1]|nr:Nicotinate-nucleotide adenylyltransferase (EC [Olavius sp. associated proteobacterium Delta 1]
MHIGLFGGTFNPVHIGHLRAALEVKEGFDLDEVILIPAALPPHKMPGDVADAADRLHMLNQALEDSPGLTISDVELKRSGPSYTIDTVQHFKHLLPEQSRIYLIMGMDAFLEIDTWKSYDELLLQIPFIIINRPKSGSAASGPGWKFMENFIASKISTDYVFSESKNCYRAKNKQPVYVFEVTSLDISSTRIRNLINKGRSIDYFVPQKVAEFINSKGLYL